MKIALVIIGLVIAALAGGHYVLWQQHSKIVAATAEQLIVTANQQVGSEHITFTYNEKKTGGYPMDVTVSYTNPTLTIASEFYEGRDDWDAQGVPQIEHIALDGELIVRNDYLSNRSASEMRGTINMAGVYYNSPVSYKVTWDDVAMCDMTLTGTPMDFVTKRHAIESAETMEQKIRALRGLSCQSDNILFQDTASNTTIVAIDKQHIAFTSKPSSQSDAHILGLDMTMEGATFATSQTETLRDLRAVFEPLNDKQASYFALAEKHPIPFLDASYGGKQNIRFKGTYEGPISEEIINKTDGNFALDIDVFDIENDIYDMSFPVEVTIATRGNEIPDMRIRHDGTTSYKPAFKKMVDESIAGILAIAHSPELQVDDATRAKLKGLTAPMLQSIIPDWSAWGDFVTAANLDTNKGDVTIDKVGFNANPFGLTVSGKGNVMKKQMDATLECRHCDTLISSITEYANNVQSLVATFEPTAQTFPVTDAARDALIGFIKQYDTDKADDTTTITFKSDASGAITISGQPAATVMFSAMTQLAPHFQPVLPQ